MGDMEFFLRDFRLWFLTKHFLLRPLCVKWRVNKITNKRGLMGSRMWLWRRKGNTNKSRKKKGDEKIEESSDEEDKKKINRKKRKFQVFNLECIDGVSCSLVDYPKTLVWEVGSKIWMTDEQGKSENLHYFMQKTQNHTKN